MIAHVILFRLRDDVSAVEREALIDAFAVALRDIPVIRRARIGRRTRMGRSYEEMAQADFPYAAVLEFDDPDGVRAYLDHPAHTDMANRFFAAAAEMVIHDFAMEPNANGLREG